ncbi:MAG TPA: hypothetical protein VLE19_18580 [Pyrinomonadaceae bacterium]|nr:hypothetical protein [Pyrinomonadaceae bacterium]
MTNSIRYSNRWRLVLLVLTVHLLVPRSSIGQTPPPLGPPPYRSQNSPQLGVGVLSGIVKTQVADIVNKANNEIHKKTSTITVEALPLKVYSPMRVATLYTNRPNQYFAQLPMVISIKVRLPATSDRTIYISLNLNVSCDSWETGKGTIKMVAKIEPPVIEGGNIVEDMFMVRDVINNLIKSQLALPSGIDVSLPNSACVTIGASSSQYVGDPFAFIAYDPPNRLGQIRDVGITPTVEVTFQKLKRLRARGNGAILYQPTESIILDTYTNFVRHQSPTLTLREDEEVALNMPASIVKTAGLDLLVIIANILQQPTFQPEDSAFAASSRMANYSPGTHTLQITKLYVEPPGPGHTKPLQMRVPAYELTYTVRYSNPGLTRTPMRNP